MSHCNTYTHTHTHTYIHTYTHTYIHTHIHQYIHTYIHTYTHTSIHTYIHTYAYIHTYICTDTHTYTHTHTHIHTHTHTHTYINTYTHTYIHKFNKFINFWIYYISFGFPCRRKTKSPKLRQRREQWTFLEFPLFSFFFCKVSNLVLLSRQVNKTRVLYYQAISRQVCSNRKEGNVLFNNALNIFYFTVIWRRTYGKGPLR